MTDLRFDPKIIGRNIKVLRLLRGMEQAELARRLDVSRPHLSSVENGHYMPSLQLVLNCAAVFKLHPSRMFKPLVAQEEE